jgi:hypothetical protein
MVFAADNVDHVVVVSVMPDALLNTGVLLRNCCVSEMVSVFDWVRLEKKALKRYSIKAERRHHACEVFGTVADWLSGDEQEPN